MRVNPERRRTVRPPVRERVESRPPLWNRVRNIP
jgi:hypothetical protein